MPPIAVTSTIPNRKLPSGQVLRSLGLVSLLTLASCGGTVNDLLQEAKLGSTEAIERAVVSIGDLLVSKEEARVAFDRGDLSAIEYLKTVARSSDVQNNRAVAIRSLGRLRTVDVMDSMRLGLNDRFWLSRLIAVQAIRALAHEEASSELIALLESEPQPEVKREIIASLGILGDDRSVRTLYRTFFNLNNESDRDEQESAYFALKKLTGLDYPFDEKGQWKQAYGERFGDEGS